MAKQDGTDPKVGTIGNLTYYKRGGEYLVKQKSTLDGERVINDKAFERTREQMSEFKKTGQAASLLRSAFAGLLKGVADMHMMSRLPQVLNKVIKSDTTNVRGERTIMNGDVRQLKRFNFNSRSSLNTVLFQHFTTAIDRIRGKATISIPGFEPGHGIKAPNEATHFRIIAATSVVDFEKGIFVSGNAESGIFSLMQDNVADIILEHALVPNSTGIIFMVMGIEFFLEEKGSMYALKNGAFNALEIVDID